MVGSKAVDRTEEFRKLVSSLPRQTPTSSSSTSSRSSTPDAWTLQAQQVATNLRSFQNFLVSIRRAYLDLGGVGQSAAAASSRGQAPTGDGGLLDQWQGVKYLTDKERDEIDFSVKIALRKSVERVRQLEQLEQVRISNEKRSKPPPSSAPSGFSKFFNLPSSSSSSSQLDSSTQLASHRSFITLYLNQLLQSVSDQQRSQQEYRVQRQLEKSASLGGFGGGGALGMRELGEKMADEATRDYKNHGKKGSRTSEQFPSIYKPTNDYDEEEEEEDGLDQLGYELTAEQIQQFEQEESALLQSTRQDLESLKTAESSLLEISSLQSQLAVHLSQQSELTDQLWNEAIEVGGRVEDGNKQLKKAKERGKDSRKWLLVFLFGSSFTLLFLDYYST
ncbi:Ufe1p [Sporobolomyces salmoneus]|uniref:Ufe1p n=1 Tax=Sporobolomyces salmoneus TaxID=183962 RepID=UPI00316E6A2D